MTIPHCEDRTVYCTLPPESIFGGEVTIDYNPSPKFFNNPDKECRWTKWLNTGKDSKGDREKITRFGLGKYIIKSSILVRRLVEYGSLEDW